MIGNLADTTGIFSNTLESIGRSLRNTSAYCVFVICFCQGCAATLPSPISETMSRELDMAPIVSDTTREIGAAAEQPLPGDESALSLSQPLALDDAIGIALVRNRRIRLALRQEGIAKDGVDLALSRFYPSIEISGGYHVRNNDPGMLMPESGQAIIASEREVFAGSIAARYLLTDFGGRYFRLQAAKLDRVIARISSMEAYRRIVLDVTEAYFGLLAARHFHEVAQDSLELLERQLAVSKDLFENDMVARNDVLSSEIRLLEARQIMITSENNISLAKAALNFQLGLDLEFPVEVSDVENIPLSPLDFKICLLMAVDHRPELQRLKTEKQHALAVVKETLSDFMPKVTAQADYNRISDEYQLNKEYVSAGLFLKWDLVKEDRVPARVSRARKFFQQVEERIQLHSQVVALEVKTAYLRTEEHYKKIDIARQTVEQAGENLRIFQDQYKNHLVSVTEVLDAQAQLTKARYDHYAARYDYYVCLARLENAIGSRFSALRGKASGNPAGPAKGTPLEWEKAKPQ